MGRLVSQVTANHTGMGYPIWLVVLLPAFVVDYGNDSVDTTLDREVVRSLMHDVNVAVTEFLSAFEKRRTSPELIQRYWADFQIGDVDSLGTEPEILSLLRKPQDLAPLLPQLKRGLLRNRAFVRLVAAIGENAPREPAASQEAVAELVHKGLNYLQLLNALTLHLERHQDALRALLIGRMTEVIFAEIPYENFFEEAKCKGVYWGVHLFTGAAGEVVCRESAAQLLHANILMAVASEGLGPRCVGAGDENASCGYLLAERVAKHGFDAISSEWQAIYHSWNAAFIVNSPCPNMDSAKITASSVLLPALIDASSGGEWLRRRAISLLLVVVSSRHPNSSLNVVRGVSDSLPFAAPCLRTWGQANRDAVHEAGLVTSHERVATLSDMTRLTRQARAMNRFLSELRSYDPAVGMTLEERQACAVDLAAAWREIANS